MPGLDLTPTLRVHPVALNVARLVNKAAAGQRIVRVTPAGTIAVRDRNGSTVL
jgi:hypothetical protein